MSTGPGFFKFFFPDTGGQLLEIPSTFARSLKSRLPDSVVLRDGYNNTWQVKVAKTGKYRYHLADGWPEFVRDNSIREEDLIIFRYSSHASFDTKILAPSGCETGGVGGFQVNEGENTRASQENEASGDVVGLHPENEASNNVESPHAENETSDDFEGPLGENKVSDDVVGPHAENEASDDFEGPLAENEARDDVVGPHAENEASDDFEGPLSESEASDDFGGSHAESEASDDVEGSQAETEDNDEYFEDHIDRANSRKRKLKTKPGAVQKARRIRRVHCDIYGHDIFQTGLAPQPQNPYFVTKINMKRKSEFYIPMELVRDNNLQLPEHVTFEDESGKHWLADRQIWKTGRIYYTKGWRQLCVSNSIQEDDLCICEFIQRGGVHFIKVSIVRAVRSKNTKEDQT